MQWVICEASLEVRMPPVVTQGALPLAAFVLRAFQTSWIPIFIVIGVQLVCMVVQIILIRLMVWIMLVCIIVQLSLSMSFTAYSHNSPLFPAAFGWKVSSSSTRGVSRHAGLVTAWPWRSKPCPSFVASGCWTTAFRSAFSCHNLLLLKSDCLTYVRPYNKYAITCPKMKSHLGDRIFPCFPVFTGDMKAYFLGGPLFLSLPDGLPVWLGHPAGLGPLFAGFGGMGVGRPHVPCFPVSFELAFPDVMISSKK